MKASSLKELKTELETLSQRQIIDVCMRLVKYKKENKELLTYLLFQAGDEQAYINEVKEHINEQFEGVNKSNLYLSKKMLRKILRTSNKFIRYSGSKQTEVELRIFFCKKLKSSGIPLHTNKALDNLYQKQIQKINTALASLHEDLQYDYSVELKELY